MNGAYWKIAQVPEVANHAVMARLFPESPYSLPANLTAATKAHNLCNSLNIIERVRLFVLEVMPELYKTVPGFGDNEEYASQLKHYKIDSHEDPLVVAVPAFLIIEFIPQSTPPPTTPGSWLDGNYWIITPISRRPAYPPVAPPGASTLTTSPAHLEAEEQKPRPSTFGSNSIPRWLTSRSPFLVDHCLQ
ncbi:hypothetical protein JCM11641_006471 [Rhodosporidiobolus odoratus]